ncbi:MAG: hypothetical protein ACI4J8_01085 [Oscillospiraceae bacterium]
MVNNSTYSSSERNAPAAEHTSGNQMATRVMAAANDTSSMVEQHTPSTTHRPAYIPFHEWVKRTNKRAIPTPRVLRCPETSSFNGGSNKNKRKRFKELKEDNISYINLKKRFINADGKYRFSKFEAVYSVNGMMYFISSNGDVPDLVVRCGPTEDTGEPVLLMKFDSQADSFFDDEDEDVNIVQPDFFVAKLVIDVDEDSCYTANISYFANDSKLSCNLASELPDANATGTLLEVFASMAAIMGTELIGDSEVNSYE